MAFEQRNPRPRNAPIAGLPCVSAPLLLEGGAVALDIDVVSAAKRRRGDQVPVGVPSEDPPGQGGVPGVGELAIPRALGVAERAGARVLADAGIGTRWRLYLPDRPPRAEALVRARTPAGEPGGCFRDHKTGH